MYKKYEINCFKLITFFIIIMLVTIKLSNAENIINTSAKYAILIDHDTGRILLNKNSDTSMSPASMSKLMTIYL